MSLSFGLLHPAHLHARERVVKLREGCSAWLPGSTGAGGIASPGTRSSRLELSNANG